MFDFNEKLIKVEKNDFLDNEVIIEITQLSGLKKSSTEAFLNGDCDKIKAVVLELLQLNFGDNVAPANIMDRVKKDIDILEEHLGVLTKPQVGVNSVAETNILLIQRILISYIRNYAKRLEKQWLDIWPVTHTDNRDISELHDVLLKYRLHMNMTPSLVLLRSLKPAFFAEYDTSVFSEPLPFDPDLGRATISLDLLQPKENLIDAFKKFIDEAKAKINEHPESKLLVNLYDFTRKPDGRRDRPLYKEWHDAINDYETASEYGSFYEAAQNLVEEPQDEGDYLEIDDKKYDPDRISKNLRNRTKRYYSLLNSVMNNTFPSQK